MVSKEEFDKYLDELMSEDKNNENLKWLTKDSFWNSEGGAVCGFLLMFFGLSCICVFVQVKNLNTLLIGVFAGICLIGLSVLSFIKAFRTMDKRSEAQKHYNEYKDKVIGYLLKDYSYELQPHEYVDKEVFLNSQIFGKKVNSYSGEDRLVIDILNKKEYECKLVMSDVKVTELNKKVCTEGIFCYAELPNDFNCTLCINSTYENEGLELEPVELENIEFNEQFKILSDNQVEARYILTPEVMCALQSMADKMYGLRVSFIGNKVYFWFGNMQLFKVDFVEDEEVTSMFSGFYEPVRVCLDVLEEIKTNKKIFRLK